MNKYRILYLEDNDIHSKLMQCELRGYDITLVRATTVAKAKNLLNSNKFDIFLMDLNVPNSYGIETAKHFKKYKLPKMVLSSMDDNVTATSIIDMDLADEFLPKGFMNGKSLMRGIEMAIARNKKNRKKEFNFQMIKQYI